MNFWYFLIKYSQIIVFTICPDPFKSARLHVWKCLCDSRHCIHFSKPEAAAALKSFAWPSEQFHEMQKNCSITYICKDFSSYRPIQDLHKSEAYSHYENTHRLRLVCLQPQSGWPPLAPLNTLPLEQLPPSSSQRGSEWQRQSRWELLRGQQLSHNTSKGHRKCFKTSL